MACFSINTVNKFLVELKLINLLNESIFSYKLQYFFLFLLVVIMGIRGFESQTFPFEPSRMGIRGFESQTFPFEPSRNTS